MTFDLLPAPRRHISAIRQGFRVWWRREGGSEYAVYLTHDLSMLRLIETFCESAPQLTLMIHVMLRANRARAVQRECSGPPPPPRVRGAAGVTPFLSVF